MDLALGMSPRMIWLGAGLVGPVLGRIAVDVPSEDTNHVGVYRVGRGVEAREALQPVEEQEGDEGQRERDGEERAGGCEGGRRTPHQRPPSTPA